MSYTPYSHKHSWRTLGTESDAATTDADADDATMVSLLKAWLGRLGVPTADAASPQAGFRESTFPPGGVDEDATTSTLGDGTMVSLLKGILDRMTR